MSRTTVPAAPASRWRRRLLWSFGTVALVASCFAARTWWNLGATPAAAEPTAGGGPSSENQPLAVMADINGTRISRQDLANEALRHYGAEVLDSLVHRQLIAEHCRLRGIQVTTQEVEQEVDRLATRFQLPRDQWLKMLKEERNITPVQYAEDIVWPTIALRKLAADRIEPTEADVQKAYETQYGETVQLRIIVSSTREKADAVHAAALAEPERFPELAVEKSEDPSASAKGLIPPARRHTGNPQVEAVAFAMQPGQISDVLQFEHQFLILKCEARNPPQRVPIDEVYAVLKDAVRDKKLRLVADQVFEELQKVSKIEVLLNDPVRSQQNPGVAAIIDGRPLSTADLAEECIKRHGTQVLDGVVNRTLIEQACHQHNIEVTEAEMQAEIAHAAETMGRLRADGQPDLEGWIKEATTDRGTTLEVYRRDVVWPSAALKKLVQNSVQVTPEDLQRGFEANYGPRVRCRAIVFNQLRRAQEVFELARERPTVENFGDLAEQYSVEAGSRVLRGEVPPIQRFGGQPVLEKEAFTLQPGQLSSIVQVGDKFVLLFCEGYTTSAAVNFEEVRTLIERDVFEKKLQIAISNEFQRLQDSAQIDNYLANTSQRPHKPQATESPVETAARPATSIPR